MRVRATLSRAFLFLTIAAGFYGTIGASDARAQQQPPPVANAGPDRTVAVGDTVVLDGSGSLDPKEMTADFDWWFHTVPAGSAAQLSAPHAVEPRFSVKPSFVADQPGQYVVKLRLTESSRVSEIDTVVITATDIANPGNSAPRAEAGPDQAVKQGQWVVLDGSASTDPDGDPLGYGWALVEAPTGSTAVLDDAALINPGFFVDLAGTYVFELTVDDGPAGHTAADRMTVSTVNVSPVAVAGPDITAVVGDKVQFDGSLSHDRDGDELSYSWALISVPVLPVHSAEELASQQYVRSTLVVDKEGIFLVQLTVTDSNGAVSRDTLVVSTVNAKPLAAAGPDQVVPTGAEVTLDASGTTDWNGDLLRFRWALVATPVTSGAALDNPASPRPTFTADVAGTYVAQLVVDDGADPNLPYPSEPSAADTVVIIAGAGNALPVADAGPPQTVAMGDTVQLDALTGTTDANGAAGLTYSWTVLEHANGNKAKFSDPTSPTSTYTFSKFGEHVLQVTVSDGEREAVDTVLITTINTRPFANPGPEQPAIPGDIVQLNGATEPDDPTKLRSRDVDGDPILFEWALIARPEGSAATLQDPNSATPTIATDIAGYYLAQLIVREESVTNPLTITKTSLPATAVVAAPNTPPVANAGADQTVYVDDRGPVALDGTASSDADDDPLTYAWSFASRPTDSTTALVDATTLAPSFTPDLAGTYVVQLIVNDGIVDSAPDTVSVFVRNPPVAEAGPDQTVSPLPYTVQLDGTASTSETGTITHAWRFTARPAGSDALVSVLSDPAAASPTFVADVPGLYVLDLVVGDGTRTSAPDTVAVRAGSGVVNTPPVLGPVEPRTVTLGGTLTIALTATDADGDPLSFFAAPLPLPAGAALDAASGVFTFRPTAEQVGVLDLTFGVSDGLDSGSESVSITVTAPPPGTVTTVTGRVLDANAANEGLEVPIVNARVVVLNGLATGFTDAQGSFSIANVPAGGQILQIGGGAANPAPDGSSYTTYREDVTLIANAINTVDPFYLGRVDATSTTPYTPNVTTTVDNPALGVTLTVAPGSAFAGVNPFSGSFSISAVPAGQFANVLPAYMAPCQLIAIEPYVLNFNPAASITLPNLDGLPADADVDIWLLHPERGTFFIVGTGRVSAVDGRIHTVSGGLPYTGLVMAVPRAPTAVAAIDMNGVNKRPTLFGAGNLSQAVSLPAYQWLGQAQETAFVYNSATANPQPVAATEVTFPANSGMPDLLEGRLIVGGNSVAGPVYTSTSGYTDPNTGEVRPDLIAGQAIRQALQFDASNLPTGSYPYRYVASSKYACSKVGAAVDGRLLVNNQEDSAFGKGWTLGGLHRITQQDDERLVLEDGAGTTTVFDPVLAETAINFDDFSDLSRFNLNGHTATINATPVTEGGQTVLRMTNTTRQSGSAFLDEAVPLEFEGGTLSFSSEFVFQFTNPGGVNDPGGILVGADGITFAIVNAPTVTGGEGAGIGYSGISSSVAVELDTYYNAARFYPNVADPDGNHVGIDINGSLKSVATAPVSPEMNNGTIWYAWIDYIGGSKTLEVRLAQTPDRPAAATLSHVVDIPAIIGTTTAYMGFTSGTGAATNDHDIRSWKVRVFGDGIDVAYATPVSDFSVMARNTGGGYTRIMKDGVAMEFDADGRQTAEIDPNGNTTAYVYDAQGRLSQIVKTPGDLMTTFVYNAAGQLETVTDPAGRVTAYDYDPAGTLLSVTYPDGSIVRYRYADGGQMTDTASARGFVTTHGYGFAGQWIGSGFPDGTSVSASISGTLGLSDFDSGLGTEANPDNYVLPENRVTTLQDAKGNLYETEVNEFGALIRTTDPIGRTTRFVRDADNLVREAIRDNDGLLPDGTIPPTVTTNIDYDDRGNVIAQTEAAGTTLARTTRFFYEPVRSRTVKIVDPTNALPDPACATAGVTCFEYDEFGNQTAVTDAKGGQQVFTHYATGLRATARDANLNVTQFFYDLAGNLTQVIDGAGSDTRLAYDAFGNVESQTEGFGTAVARTTAFTYDEMNRLLTETDPEGGISEIRYDVNGNTIEEIDQTGIAVTSVYDVRDRLVKETHPATGITRWTYDQNGNLRSLIDPLGNITHYQYDAVNRAERTEDPLNGVRFFAYDLQDDPKQITDANGNATDFKYDVHGRQIERSNALGNTWTFAYDSRDNMVEIVDAVGQTINKTFDELNRLTSIELVQADGVTVEDIVTFTYDALGLKTSAVDSDSALAWTYDGANRVRTAEIVAAPGTVQPAVVLTHGYDAVGNRDSLTHGPDAVLVDGTWHYLHDGNGDLTRVTLPTLEHVELLYDPVSRLERIVAANTAEMQVLYDALTGRPDRIAHTLGAAALARFDYGFDTDGKITSIADAGGTRIFTYDATDQLKTGGYAAMPESYSYDAEGNRTASHLSAIHSHDAANRLREDDTTCYDYDANGNLATRREKVGLDCTDVSGAATGYTWDVLNRLVRIDFPDGTWATYRYDAVDRRIEKSVNGTITRYVYDGVSILLEYDGANLLQARYTHGEEIDQPLAMARDIDTDGQLGALEQFFFHTDHLGSVRLLTDAGGGVANRYDYDSFGNLEATSFETVSNPFGFTARERDAESGLMFYRARYYDSAIGRFLSEDPIGFESTDLSLYRYGFNNPVRFSDPLGLTAAAETGAQTAKAGARIGPLGSIGRNLACLFGQAAAVSQLAAQGIGKVRFSPIKAQGCGASQKLISAAVKKIACTIISDRSKSNKVRGDLGENLVAEVLAEVGFTLLESQVDFKWTKGGKQRRVVADFLHKLGNVNFYTEVKTGQFAKLTPAQKIGYPKMVAAGKAIFRIKFNKKACK